MTPLEQIRNAYSNVMAMRTQDLWTVDFTAVAFLSCKLLRHETPLLCTIIAAPGTGKSEILKPYNDMPGCGFEVGDFTANAWVSGSPTISTSIFHMVDRRLITISDLTPLMDKDGTKLKELLCSMRMASDGAYPKGSGAKDGRLKVTVHAACIAGATEIFYVFMERDTNFGQRFLALRHCDPMDNKTRRWIAKKALYADVDSGWRAELSREVRNGIGNLLKRVRVAGFSVPHKILEGEDQVAWTARSRVMAKEVESGWHRAVVPVATNKAEYEEATISLSNTLAYMRSATLESETVNFNAEMPSRCVKQFHMIQRLRACLDGRTDTNEEDYELARRVARSSLTPNRLLLLKHLYAATNKRASEKGTTAGALNSRTGAGETVISELLRGLEHNKFVEQVGSMDEKIYYLSDFAMEEVEQCHILDPT